MSEKLQPTKPELAWLALARCLKQEKKNQIYIERQIGRLSFSYRWTSANSLLGRFGGGWNWKLGIQAGGRSVIFNLLVCCICITLKARKK